MSDVQWREVKVGSLADIKRFPSSRLEQLTHDIYGHTFTDVSATYGANHGLMFASDKVYIVDFTLTVEEANYLSAEFAAGLDEDEKVGSNYLYTIIEQQIIGAYDLGVLTPELVDVLCKAVGNSDIDSGGSAGLTTKDGKNLEDILMEMFLPGNPYPMENAHVDENGIIDDNDWDAVDEWYDKFHTLAEERWGWR